MSIVIQSITFGNCWLFVKEIFSKVAVLLQSAEGFSCIFLHSFYSLPSQVFRTRILIPRSRYRYKVLQCFWGCTVTYILGFKDQAFYCTFTFQDFFFIFFYIFSRCSLMGLFFVWDELCLLMAPLWGHVAPMGRQRVFQSVPGTAFATTRSSPVRRGAVM